MVSRGMKYFVELQSHLEALAKANKDNPLAFHVIQMAMEAAEAAEREHSQACLKAGIPHSLD